MNAEIAAVIAEMGHTDTLAIVDAGFPISRETRRIDIALKEGMPSFMDVVSCVLQELCVEELIVASEMGASAPATLNVLVAACPGAGVTHVSHEELKELSKHCKAVIRTGECTPYANVCLRAGVIF